MTEIEVTGLFALAGFEVLNKWELINKYWNNNETMGPWWLVKTKFGLIRIGWRKRVIEIDWSDTMLSLPEYLTEDDVTKGLTYVHAYGNSKALEYLTTLKQRLSAKLTVGDVALGK